MRRFMVQRHCARESNELPATTPANKKTHRSDTIHLYLHPLDRGQTQQPHRTRQHLPRHDIQKQPRLLLFRLGAFNLDRLPRRSDEMRNLETPRDQLTGFRLLVGVLHGKGVHGEVVDNVVHFGVVEDGQVNLGYRLGEDGVGVFTLDRGEADVCVLDEWAEIAFERCAAFNVECVVVDTTGQ